MNLKYYMSYHLKFQHQLSIYRSKYQYPTKSFSLSGFWSRWLMDRAFLPIMDSVECVRLHRGSLLLNFLFLVDLVFLIWSLLDNWIGCLVCIWWSPSMIIMSAKWSHFVNSFGVVRIWILFISWESS